MQDKRNKKKEQKSNDHDIEIKIIIMVAKWGFDAVCVCQQQFIN